MKIIKNFWNSIFGIGGRLDRFYSKDEKEQILQYKNLLEQKREQIELMKVQHRETILKLDSDLTKTQNNLLNATKELDFVRSQLSIKKDIPEEFLALREHYDTKYPKGDIFYSGRPIRHLVSGQERFSVPNVLVCNFIYDFEDLRRYVRSRNLTWESYFDKHKSFKIAMDKIREDIYKEVIAMRRYRFDKDLFGFDEYWSGPWIAYFLRIGARRYMDCEDSSLLMMSLLKAAGVPRGFQRVVCGNTKLGGHAAVCCYSFEKEKWEHFETTGINVDIFDAKDLSKQLAINNIWFSFDDRYSWSTNPADISNLYDRTKK